MAGLKFLISSCFLFFMVFLSVATSSRLSFGSKIDQTWKEGRATFYGDMTGNETMEGACGYGDLFKQGYGLATAALSVALFNNGSTCGACYEIKCVNDPKWCIPNAGSIIITGTNLCPANYSKSTDIWCNPPQQHFDLSMPMFTKIAQYKAGVIPVQFRRVACSKQGGVKFENSGNPDWNLWLVYNVGGAGDVTDMKIKGTKTGWLQMQRNWGQNWVVATNLVGQGLSFQVTTSDGKMVTFNDVAPPNWQFRQAYDGKLNF